jgi:hypothetical protein
VRSLLLGLSRPEWVGLHIVSSVLFTLFAVVHLVLNGRVLLSYLRTKLRRGVNGWLELLDGRPGQRASPDPQTSGWQRALGPELRPRKEVARRAGQQAGRPSRMKVPRLPTRQVMQKDERPVICVCWTPGWLRTRSDLLSYCYGCYQARLALGFVRTVAFFSEERGFLLHIWPNDTTLARSSYWPFGIKIPFG